MGKIKAFYQKHHDLLWEIFRFLVVGGIATLVDYGVYAFFRWVIFPKDTYLFNTINLSVAIATIAGFCAGLIVNYVLSIFFVFKNAKNEKAGRSVKGFILFTIIGVLGLLLSIGGMQVFVEVIGWSGLMEYIGKAIMTCIVLVWNYLGRKIFIFK